MIADHLFIYSCLVLRAPTIAAQWEKNKRSSILSIVRATVPASYLIVEACAVQ